MDEKFQGLHRSVYGVDSDGPPILDRSKSFQKRRRPVTHKEAFVTALRDRTIRRLIFLFCFLTTVWVIVHRAIVPSHNKSSTLSDDKTEAGSALPSGKPASEGNPHGVFANYTRVPLEVHVMSKCSDAKRCLTELVVPSMERISEKVDFQLSFIGTVDPKSDAVSCKHGPSECLGNMILLCASHLYPSAILSLGFANCVISSYQSIPDRELVESCSLEHGLDFSKINDCLSDDGGEGVDLLRESVERSEAAGVIKSCTVRVSGKEWCIVDGGKWSGCKQGQDGVVDLVERVGKEWEKLND